MSKGEVIPKVKTYLKCAATRYMALHRKENGVFFDARWYKKAYHLPPRTDAYKHYLEVGRRKHYCINQSFSPIRYLADNPDVREAHVDPFLHYVQWGRAEHRSGIMVHDVPQISAEQYAAECAVQDKRMEQTYDRDAERLIVYLEPYISSISGGVMCISNYSFDIREMDEIQGAISLLATVPSEYNTFSDYLMFDAHDHVYRFSQLCTYFRNVQSMVLHIPDCEISGFIERVTPDEMAWLQRIPNLQINLLNQNNELMPLPHVCDLLRCLTEHVTMTCAHAAYANAYQRSTYNVPVHFIPANKKVKYHIVPFEQKEDILALSPDQHPRRDEIVRKIREAFPELEVVEIWNLPFNEYLELIGRAKWVISFGEGYDGYTIESLCSNTISFTLFNDVFFAPGFVPWPNMFANASQMEEQIVGMMKRMATKESYMAFLQQTQAACFGAYVGVDYLGSLRRYYAKEYDFPFEPICQNRIARLERGPLVSVLMVTHQAEAHVREQLDSIVGQTYRNIELLIYDRDSDDGTGLILDEYAKKPFVRVIKGTAIGKNQAIEELVRLAKGEYIALADQDDVWAADKLSYLVEHIDEQIFCFGDVDEINGAGERKSESRIWMERKRSRICSVKECLQPQMCVPACGLLVTQKLALEALPFISEDMPASWWFIIYALLSGGNGHYVDHKVASVRYYPEKELLQQLDSHRYSVSILKAMNQIKQRYGDKMSPENKREIELCGNAARVRGLLGQFFPQGIPELFAQNNVAFSDKRIKEFQEAVQIMMQDDGYD